MSETMRRTPFFKILIANRGEIALRIMRTARRMGYGVVAVYSDADRDAVHVREADQAVRIGESLPAQSYLDIEAIIAAAKASGAGAVHPGYGFLAENETFARACRDAGLVFIGPSPDAIGAMGNKAGAKEIMAEAGVPVVPGFQGTDQRDAAMLAEAGKIGFPVMIKAVAGGGGRGMRLVSDASAFPDALRNARSEAKAAFGDGAVILERAIEEAPSPAVSPELRATMGAVAVAAVKALAYEGAGTLEFLLDESGAFYFMEMNTRLQVEHPVTEAITGLDLVELQLRIASGEPLGLRQEDVTFSGHAIEVRLCAEDAGHDFMPQSGTMARWRIPQGARVEHALRSGSEISPFYDSMIAKIVSHGADRGEARGKLICALEQTVAFGVTTNQSFLMSCLRHPVFGRGLATTAFIGGHQKELVAGEHREEAPVEGVASEAALVALLLHLSHPFARNMRNGRTLSATFPVPLRVEAGGSVHDLELLRDREGGYRVNDGGRDHHFDIEEIDADIIRFRNGAVIESVEYLRDGDRLWFLHRGSPHAVRDLTLAAPAAIAANGGDGKVRASMNGRVVAVLVKLGDRVAAGQAVMTLEAMKMQHVHAAAIAGTVASIDVIEGEQVAMGNVVVEIAAN